jgi:hypothetical protein
VVFQDETGFTLHPRLGFAWGKRGRRLRVATTSQHRNRLNISGWVAPLLGRQGKDRIEQGNTEGFLAICPIRYSPSMRLDRAHTSLKHCHWILPPSFFSA